MFSIRELRDRALIRPVKREAEDELLALPGVVAVDIGDRLVAGKRTGEHVIVVSVVRKLPAGRASAEVPREIRGIPTDVIEADVQPCWRSRVLPHIPTQSQISAARLPATGVVRGGSGICPSRTVGPTRNTSARAPELWGLSQVWRIGTLGVLVAPHTPGGAPLGLTTFDVACLDDAWSVGDPMVDPSTGKVFADLARAALSSRVNAAAVALSYGMQAAPVVAGIGPVTGYCAAYVGEAVRKSGFGTGITLGTVLSTDATVRVDHGDTLGSRVLRDQLRVRGILPRSSLVAAGDAGSVLMNSAGRVVGLVSASNADGTEAFACPITEVLTELDVDPLCVDTQRMQV